VLGSLATLADALEVSDCDNQDILTHLRPGQEPAVQGATVTEQQWLNNRDDAQHMLTFLRDTTKVARTRSGKRKLRLFASGCGRSVWPLLNHPQHRKVVEAVERVADGQVSAVALASVGGTIDGSLSSAAALVETIADPQAFQAAFLITTMSMPVAGLASGGKSWDHILSDLLRDIFGNPFRAVSTDPTWLTPTVVSLATAIYDERAFDRLPIVADALDDGGCDCTDLLHHLRQPGDHVRGCWALDQVLGKE
jgi:hypothetical protein